MLYHVRVVMCLHAGFCRGRDSFAASGILLDSRNHVITLSSGFSIQSYESYLTVGDVLLFLPVYFIFAKLHADAAVLEILRFHCENKLGLMVHWNVYTGFNIQDSCCGLISVTLLCLSNRLRDVLTINQSRKCLRDTWPLILLTEVCFQCLHNIIVLINILN